MTNVNFYRHYRYYNGVNHRVDIYLPGKRKEESWKPTISLDKAVPLNVTKCKREIFTGFYAAPGEHSQCEPLNGYERYDVVIVSEFYAEYAVNSKLPVDYLDRLYTLLPLMKGGQKFGASGIQKVVAAQPPEYYSERILAKEPVSLAAVHDCLTNPPLFGDALSIVRFSELLNNHATLLRNRGIDVGQLA